MGRFDPEMIPSREALDAMQAADPARAAEIVAVARELSRRSYACFLRYWMCATRAPFMWNWHWAYLADIMQAVADRDEEVRFLIVNIPPRFAKSTLLSQLWQAWMIGREDSRRSSLFSTACTATLAARDSRRTLETVKSSWYRALFPNVRVGNGKETENEWETSGGAYRIACGTGGTVTGRGADHLLCIAQGQRVLIDRGWVPIEAVRAGDSVATPEGWRRVTRSRRTGRRRVVRLRAGGSILLLTPDHRCSTPEGWREAGTLDGGFVHAIQADSEAMRCLRQVVPRVEAADTGVQSYVWGSPAVGVRGCNEDPSSLPDLRQAVPPPGSPQQDMQPGLPRESCSDTMRRGGEPSLEARAASYIPRSISKAHSASYEGACRGLPEVWGGGESDCAPCERGPQGRHAGQPHGAVSPMPYEATCRDAEGEADVYDLTVEGAHCFYAEGILVHNCDDPIQADDANSELIREKANEWIGETFRSRLDDVKTGTITVIMQRLHERDLTGYLLERSLQPGADKYHHIVLPHEAPSRTVVSFKGTTYATREPGDLLHPDRIGPKEAAALRASMRHNYDGQYQQTPTKMQGAFFNVTRLVRLKGTALELKSRLGLTPAGYLDFAATEKQTQKNDPDFNVCLIGAKDEMGRVIILDIWRKQTADYALFAMTVGKLAELWRPRWMKGEKGALLNQFQVAMTREVQRSGRGPLILPLKGRSQDKAARAMNAQALMNAGMICVPEDAPWLPEFERELRGFPLGAHDDQIDPLADLCNDLQLLPAGETPPTNPDNPAELLSNEVKEDLQRKLAADRNPKEEDGWDW